MQLRTQRYSLLPREEILSSYLEATLIWFIRNLTNFTRTGVRETLVASLPNALLVKLFSLQIQTHEPHPTEDKIRHYLLYKFPHTTNLTHPYNGADCPLTKNNWSPTETENAIEEIMWWRLNFLRTFLYISDPITLQEDDFNIPFCIRSYWAFRAPAWFQRVRDVRWKIRQMTYLPQQVTQNDCLW